MRGPTSTRVRWLVVLLGVPTLCFSSLLPACTPYSVDTGRLVVAVTLEPQAGFVEAIAGDRAEIVVMVPPGASPHTYEVTPEQMVLLSRAKMYAKVGSGFEFELSWMDRLVAANREMLVVDCSNGVQLIEADGDAHDEEPGDNDTGGDDLQHSGADPHIWLSVTNARVIVRNLCEGLVQVDPANAAFYQGNCDAYVDALSLLDEELRDALEGLESRRFIVFHPAFGYFARDYNLIQVAVEQGGNEPDAQYMVRLIREAEEYGIRVVFAAPQLSTRSAEVVAREIGGEVVIIDPLARDYISNMRAVAEAIRHLE